MTVTWVSCQIMPCMVDQLWVQSHLPWNPSMKYLFATSFPSRIIALWCSRYNMQRYWLSPWISPRVSKVPWQCHMLHLVAKNSWPCVKLVKGVKQTGQHNIPSQSNLLLNFTSHPWEKFGADLRVHNSKNYLVLIDYYGDQTFVINYISYSEWQMSSSVCITWDSRWILQW